MNDQYEKAHRFELVDFSHLVALVDVGQHEECRSRLVPALGHTCDGKESALSPQTCRRKVTIIPF